MFIHLYKNHKSDFYFFLKFWKMKFKVWDKVRITSEAIYKFHKWWYPVSQQEKRWIIVRKVWKRNVFCSNGRTYSKSFLEKVSQKTTKEIAEKFWVAEDFILID